MRVFWAFPRTKKTTHPNYLISRFLTDFLNNKTALQVVGPTAWHQPPSPVFFLVPSSITKSEPTPEARDPTIFCLTSQKTANADRFQSGCVRRWRGVGAQPWPGGICLIACARSDKYTSCPVFRTVFIDYRTDEPGLPRCENHVKTITSVQLGWYINSHANMY